MVRNFSDGWTYNFFIKLITIQKIQAIGSNPYGFKLIKYL
jgi:hypothetical protein